MKGGSSGCVRSMVSSRPNENRKTGPGHLWEMQMSCSMFAPLVIYPVGEKVSINAHQADSKRNPPSQIQQPPLSFSYRRTPSPCHTMQLSSDCMPLLGWESRCSLGADLHPTTVCHWRYPEQQCKDQPWPRCEDLNFDDKSVSSPGRRGGGGGTYNPS